MPLGNIVILQTGQPERMHFSDHTIETRTITDPASARPQVRNTLVMEVVILNGARVNARFSTMAEGLYSKLEPYLAGRKYLDYDFTITAVGEGFQRKYTVLVTPVT